MWKKITSTRVNQHKKNVEDEKWDLSGSNGCSGRNHGRICKEGLKWDDVSLLTIEENRFDRKMREALEIQFR